jgi:glycosyltransferase involved in cell wall biosynthesis
VEHDYDLVIGTSTVNLHAAFAARLAQKPLVWQFVDSRLPRALSIFSGRVLARYADTMMFWGSRLRQWHGLSKQSDRSLDFFPAIALERFSRDSERRARTRRLLGIENDVVLVGTVANVNPQKGIQYFVQAARKVSAAFPGKTVEFIVAGATYPNHAAYLEELRAEASNIARPSKCTFVLDPPDIAAILDSLDVQVISSMPRSEGIPTTMLEGMAMELPVVATKVGSIDDCLVDGMTGILVRPQDPDALAREIIALADGPRLRAEMGARAREAVVKSFSLDRCADIHAEAFNRAVESSKAERDAHGTDES